MSHVEKGEDFDTTAAQEAAEELDVQNIGGAAASEIANTGRSYLSNGNPPHESIGYLTAEWDREGFFRPRIHGGFGFIEDGPELVEEDIRDGVEADYNANASSLIKGGARSAFAGPKDVSALKLLASVVYPPKLDHLIENLREPRQQEETANGLPVRHIAPEVYELSDVPAPDINTHNSVDGEAADMAAPKIVPLPPYVLGLYIDPKVSGKLDPTGGLQRMRDEYIEEHTARPGYDYPERRIGTVDGVHRWDRPGGGHREPLLELPILGNTEDVTIKTETINYRTSAQPQVEHPQPEQEQQGEQ